MSLQDSARIKLILDGSIPSMLFKLATPNMISVLFMLVITFSEIFFASFIALGFFLHTLGFAQLGVVISCIAGICSATAFNFLLGWSTFFHLWYINLAILIIAVPLKIGFKSTLAIIFVGIYCTMFLFLSDNRPLYEIPSIRENILGLSKRLHFFNCIKTKFY